MPPSTLEVLSISISISNLGKNVKAFNATFTLYRKSVEKNKNENVQKQLNLQSSENDNDIWVMLV